MPSLAWRFLRALWVFSWILGSYLFQMLLVSLLSTWDIDPASGRERERLPDWLRQRKKRVDARNARRLLKGTLALRGVYIKLGQVLSIMGGFLPRVYQRELEQLQDAVPPQPYPAIRLAFFESLGLTPEEAFERFDPTPIAAASLGQVHVAWLPARDGTSEPRKVAIKVLYPGIRDVITVDMRVIGLAVLVYRWFVPVQGIERVHAALVDLLRRETDYVHEAACMERMAKNFARQKDIVFPEVVRELSSADVLTMTFIEGTKINRTDELREKGIDPMAVATRFVESFYEQLFVHRFFHADPHPGNFLVQPGRTPRRPKLVILDFGAVSEVAPHLVDGMVDVLGGLLEENRDKLLRGIVTMGFVSRDANRELFEKTVTRYFEKLLLVKSRTPGALTRANSRELEALVDPEVAREELRELMRSVEYPDGWFYVERASVLAFWLCGQIAPDLDAMLVGYPYVMPLLAEARARAAREAAESGGDVLEGQNGPGEHADLAASDSTADPGMPVGLDAGEPHALAGLPDPTAQAGALDLPAPVAPGAAATNPPAV